MKTFNIMNKKENLAFACYAIVLLACAGCLFLLAVSHFIFDFIFYSFRFCPNFKTFLLAVVKWFSSFWAAVYSEKLSFFRVFFKTEK